MTEREPKPWRDEGAPPDVRAVLDASKDHEPGPDALAALEARLAAVLPAGALGVGAAAGGKAGAAGAAGASAGVGAKAMVVAAVIATGALGGGAWLASGGAGEPPSGLPRAVPSVMSAPPSPPPPVSVAPEPPAVPPPSPSQAPAPAQPSAPRAPVPVASSPPESALLADAQRALVGGEPARALALVDAHARAYPGGSLVQEREMLAIQALVAQGRRADAAARAAAFRRAYPGSTHLARLDALVPPP